MRVFAKVTGLLKERLVAFKFTKASCVALGTFNMYVVQPQWLANMKVLEAGQEFLIETNFAEPGFRFKSRKSSAQWIITPTKIAIETTDPEDDCGRTIAKILELLPHTPMQAIGNNAFYEAQLESASELDGVVPECKPVKIPEGYELAQRTFHVGFKKSAAIYNLQAAVTAAVVQINSNVHYPLDGKTAAIAADCARRMAEDRTECESLINRILRVQIENATANA